MIERKQQIRFRRFGIFTIAAVFFLIFIGGLVRSTGSGMGCPDWPTCFGYWVPPTEVSQLPDDYKTRFAIAGKEIVEFNAFKTWTEYGNRLVGVTIGILIFLTVVFALPYLKSGRKKIFWLSFLAFLLVGFQGWLGAKVVSSDLAVYMVTLHMLLALIIVGLLIYTITASQDFVILQNYPNPLLRPLVLLILLVALVQIVSGTQVREVVDEVAKRFDNRTEWVNQLGSVFLFHRSWSWLNLGLTLFLLIQSRKLFGRESLIYRASLSLILMMCLQAFSGAVLANLSFPAQFQSIHLTLGSLSAGLQIFIAILVLTKVKPIKENI